MALSLAIDAIHKPQPLAALVDINQILIGTPTLRTALRRVLEILERDAGAGRAAVTLVVPNDSPLQIESHAAPGGTLRARYNDEITGRVIESGRPVVVPPIACVPIILNRSCAGALTVDLPHKADRNYEGLVSFLTVVTSMMAQAVKVERLVDTERQRLLEENTQLREELRERYDFSHVIGNSGPMRRVYEQITQVARTNTTVLIRGESGTGKELIAHAIHYNSARSAKPFVKVSCAALPDELIESELFGYEKGAFTGALARKKGRFELAEAGTLFLDEIGDVSLATQVKLLRVLQERELDRLGGTEPVKVNVRLIAATHKDLEKAIAAGAFREDLHYRLNVFSIFVPPLRERTPDILLLADHFLEKFSIEHHKNIKRISTPAIDMLTAYHWPGNVRELANVIERAVLVCEANVIHGHHLPPTLQTAEASGTVMNVSLEESVSAYEKDLIMDALKTTRGNQAKAAKLLHSTERIINYKVRQYAVDCRRFR